MELKEGMYVRTEEGEISVLSYKEILDILKEVD